MRVSVTGKTHNKTATFAGNENERTIEKTKLIIYKNVPD